MKEFLKSVADHYFGSQAIMSGKEFDWMSVTDYLFVFPSRRSGLFFAQYLYDIRNSENPDLSIPVLAPQSTTIADLFACFTEVRLADHTQLLFELYKVYQEVMAEEVRKAAESGEGPVVYKQEDFDSFVFWCEMLLNDFSDVDRYLVNARQLFYNVRDLKEVDESMGGPFAGLSEEAKEAIRTFWRHVNPEERGSQYKSSFKQTWSVLYEIYQRFREVLEKRGIAYDGMRQRQVVEAIPSGALDAYLDDLPKHIVFVGITAINEAERALLKWLQKMGRAEFCWDYADYHLKSDDFSEEGVHANASFFTRRNLADFPNALSDEELDPYLVPEKDREVVRIPVPSGVGQATEAANILRNWGTEDAIHTAVVLADENLLVPMCFSVPGEFHPYNVTMGYSMRSTQAYSFVDALSELQNNYRASSQSYYFKPVLALLGHSFLLNLEPEVAPNLSNAILKEGLYQVPVSRLVAASPLLAVLFRPAQNIADAKKYLEEVFQYLTQLTEIAEEKIGLNEHEEESKIGDLEREGLICYQQQLSELCRQIQESGISDEVITRHTIFRLLQRLAGSRRVSFTGEPLSGLQVMGILETRALDFERIVILSMNEGIIPTKPSQNSFIPVSLRNAFGLPTQRHKDSVIAYHFYRLLSRARHVALLFDSRTAGMKSGEESRYLLQLRYLSNCKIVNQKPNFSITTEDQTSIVVPKSPEVLAKLNDFRSGIGHRSLSATSLKSFIACPLQFYLAQVERLRESDEIADEVGDEQFGDILHTAMEILYREALGKRITTDNIRNLLQSDAVDLAIDRAFLKVMKGAERTGYFELILRLVRQYIVGILKYDATQMPMTYLASEGEQRVAYPVNDTLSVNMRAVYDRIDIVYDQQGRGILRIVDYKTGSPSKKLDLGTMAELFLPKGKGSKEAFQVLFYCLMLRYASPATLQSFNLSPQTPLNAYNIIQPHLYFTRHFLNADNAIKTQLSDNMEVLSDFNSVADDFEKELRLLISRIFDPEVPFTQCDDTHTCGYCPFKDICGR